MDQQTGQVYAVGEKARQMLGRTPATIVATRPLRHGVIADFETTEQMLGQFIRLVGGSRMRRAVIVCVPSGLTQVERDAVVEATLSAGAREAHLIEEAMAGAIGAGLPVEDAIASLVVDVGGGTTEMAVIALGGIVVPTSLPVGGYDLDDAIVRFVQDQHRLLVGHEQAERVKIEIGSALAGHAAAAETEVAGRYMSTGMLARITLGEDDVRRALERPLSRIVAGLKELLEQTPAQLASDIAARGVTLVGGGALLPGFADLIRERDRAARQPRSRAADDRCTRRGSRPFGARRAPALAAPPALAARPPLSRYFGPRKVVKARDLPADREFVEMQHPSIEDLRSELVDLEAKAARLSQMRSHLHHQIDFGFETATTREREREVSDERIEIHRQIDSLKQTLRERETA